MHRLLDVYRKVVLERGVVIERETPTEDEASFPVRTASMWKMQKFSEVTAQAANATEVK